MHSRARELMKVVVFVVYVMISAFLHVSHENPEKQVACREEKAVNNSNYGVAETALLP